MLPTGVSSISGCRLSNTAPWSRCTRTTRDCASDCVRTMPTWIRKRPSGLAAATAVTAGSGPLRTSVLLDHPLDLGPAGAAAGAGWGGGIDAVVDGAGGGAGGGGAEDEPPNQPANGFHPPLDCVGAACACGEVTASDA